MSAQRYKREDYDFSLDDERYRHERRRDRSSSRNRSRRYARDSRSRSSSRSLDRRRHRRRHSRSASRSRSRGHRERHYAGSRHRDSRSRSRSRSLTHARRSRTPTRHDKRDERHNRHTRSRSRSRNSLNENESNSNNAAPNMQAMIDESNTCTSSASSAGAVYSFEPNLETLPLPKQRDTGGGGAYFNLDTETPIDKERIHREIEEKLRQTLAKEGKVYPPPKPEASHPVFANDGSFLEIFKKMQQAQQKCQQVTVPTVNSAAAVLPVAASTSTAAYVAASAAGKSAPPPPIVGRRRGGKILKTGLVAKPKIQTEQNADPKDFWSLYLAEVNKYKNNACESDGGTRPLVK